MKSQIQIHMKGNGFSALWKTSVFIEFILTNFLHNYICTVYKKYEVVYCFRWLHWGLFKHFRNRQVIIEKNNKKCLQKYKKGAKIFFSVSLEVENWTMEEIARSLPHVKPGGQHSPYHCRARWQKCRAGLLHIFIQHVTFCFTNTHHCAFITHHHHFISSIVQHHFLKVFCYFKLFQPQHAQ